MGAGAIPGGRVVALMGTAGLAVGAAGILAAVHWEDVYLTPEEGLGYALGVAGLGMMVLLLGYSLRKRLRSLASWGPVGGWFRIHMLLGILGPLAVLAHTGLSLGSLNGTVALACTLVVAGSGVIGRFLYTRVHYGLDGRRRELAEMRAAASSSRRRLLDVAGSRPGLAERIEALEALALHPAGGLATASARVLRVRFRSRRVVRAMRQHASRGLRWRDRARVRRAAREYRDSLRSAARFAFYERVFALWHHLHLPLTFLLYASATVHVLAVHMY